VGRLSHTKVRMLHCTAKEFGAGEDIEVEVARRIEVVALRRSRRG